MPGRFTLEECRRAGGEDSSTPSHILVSTPSPAPERGRFAHQKRFPSTRGHTVGVDDGSFSSPPLGKDKSWSHTFDKAGIYKIHIKEHPGAKGEIGVK